MFLKYEKLLSIFKESVCESVLPSLERSKFAMPDWAIKAQFVLRYTISKSLYRINRSIYPGPVGAVS